MRRQQRVENIYEEIDDGEIFDQCSECNQTGVIYPFIVGPALIFIELVVELG